ncbi:DUF5655 domain-containing protein [Spirilliplanes yamanashiensis]|uniref:DUF5655 domain-containing protein n=1 Tax=Spirilliplanes yamanashiensis TaxID=42233 RepID=A0A8J4DIS1_9ACTN|nr:DUF5655 domain-containing protein [Spirilliplanes yamanashiensis]MDP9814818.1 hypothetical protein [Spirilliplanes yamanashiensis]GIJ02473.1 hypothetical protein Sya03_18250 [Spirilliplanes yamanashiensis]
MAQTTPEEFFAEVGEGLTVFRHVDDLVRRVAPDVTVRVSKSQVAFRRRRGFAFLWLPGQYLAKPAADIVLSIALRRRLRSDRFKEIVHPAAGTWMHHLEIHSVRDVDDEVAGWLREAAGDAAAPGSARG